MFYFDAICIIHISNCNLVGSAIICLLLSGFHSSAKGACFNISIDLDLVCILPESNDFGPHLFTIWHAQPLLVFLEVVLYVIDDMEANSILPWSMIEDHEISIQFAALIHLIKVNEIFVVVTFNMHFVMVGLWIEESIFCHKLCDELRLDAVSAQIICCKEELVNGINGFKVHIDCLMVTHVEVFFLGLNQEPFHANALMFA